MLQFVRKNRIKRLDGHRDRDVTIFGTVDGSPYAALIECKDYDRERTGPVGIPIVDAPDSKRSDLNVDIAIICSNAGFTEPAVRKATRVGIVLNGTGGAYDFLCRRVRVATGPYRIHSKGIDIRKGTPIGYPPVMELEISTGSGEAWLQLLYLENANRHKPVPPPDDLIVERNLCLKIAGLPLECDD